MPNTTQPIAFFDVDYTILDGNSGYYTTLRLVRHGVMKKRRLIQALYYSLAFFFKAQDVSKIYRVALADLEGLTLERVYQIGQETFEKDLKTKLYMEAINQMKDHKEKGHRVVLLSSAPYMTIEAFRNYLPIDELYCMGPQVKDGILTKDPLDPVCYAEGKIYYARKDAKEQGVSLDQCYFYSDHYSDLHLLEIIGHPRAVNPDKRLKKVASQRGWPILEFKERIKWG